jgi:hypothetical protein
MEVVENQQLDEARPIYSRGGEQRRTQTPRQIGVKSAPHNIPRGGTTISDRDPEGKRLFTGDQDRGKGSKAARRAAALKNEELDIFDVVLEFLQAEGFAETLEEAEWMMANLIDEEAVAIILEDYYEGDEEDLDEGASGNVAARAQKLANQRKGQTPERKKMYQGLADKAAERERGPFKRGTSRQGMTPAERTRSREAAAYQADVHGGSATYGKGSLPKGKKLERQRVRGVSERFEAWLDEALTGDRAKKAIKKSTGLSYLRYHGSGKDASKLQTGLGGRGEKGKPKTSTLYGYNQDRGSGNKAARRAGKPVYDSRQEDYWLYIMGSAKHI